MILGRAKNLSIHFHFHNFDFQLNFNGHGATTFISLDPDRTGECAQEQDKKNENFVEDYIAEERNVEIWETGMCPYNVIFFLFFMCATPSVSRIRESIVSALV